MSRSTRARAGEARHGFTLLELLVSVTLALALTTMAMVAFFNIRKLIVRSEARLAMHAAAQGLYNSLYRSFSGIQQTCAFVVYSKANSESDPKLPPNDQVSIVFMHGKEDTQDWQWGTRGYFGQGYKAEMNSDLLWEVWTWRDATRILYTATNSPVRSFTPPGSFTPSGGVEFGGQGFDALPQPRRSLNAPPVSPTSWQRVLNDNIYFPDSTGADSPRSLSGAIGDIGDWQDLSAKLAPALAQMSEFSLEIVPHDGTAANTVTVDGTRATTPDLSRVLDGVWLDGRLASTLTAAPNFATSDAAKRPRLVRVRFTLTDPRAKLSQAFSFTFNLSDLSPEPPPAS